MAGMCPTATGTALAGPNILNDFGPLLIENLIVENVLPGLKQFLSYDEQDNIQAPAERGSKVAALLWCLERKTSCKSYEAFDAFIQLLGGTQPDLFEKIVGRAPTASEADFCITGFSQSLKTEIKKKGHKRDSALDEEIEFDKEYVELQIVKNESDTEKLSSLTLDGKLPHEHQHYLSELEKENRYISACDVLGSGDNDVKRVLVSGRPGVGKTTTLQWLARQWALGKWATGFTLLFMLQLRVLTHTNTHMTALELLSLYGLFSVTEAGGNQVLHSWLQNGTERLILLIDGLDELSGFLSKMKNSLKISDMHTKAHPVDICINILRGDLLAGCTIICTSRPFSGLSGVSFHRGSEILGLGQKQIHDFVQKKHPARAVSIMRALKGNPLLSSVCGITFYCMAITTLLNDGVTILDSELQTYTRLMAFILVQLVLRRLSDWPLLLEISPYFRKLAKLAHMGIFSNQECEGLSRNIECEGLSKIIFSEFDLTKVELNISDLESIRSVGLLHMTEIKSGHRNSITSEFPHLSLQEILAALHFYSSQSFSRSVLDNLFLNGHFNMTLLFLFGLEFDAESNWINDLRNAVGLSSDQAHENIKEGFNRWLSKYTKDIGESRKKVMICQLVHEGQNAAYAASVCNGVAPNGKLDIEGTAMTAIDLKAVAFVCEHSKELNGITFKGVNADDAFIEVMSSSLLRSCQTTLQTLNISQNQLDSEGAKTIAEWLKKHAVLQVLDISLNDIGDEGAVAIAECLVENERLHALCVSSNGVGNEGAKAVARALQKNDTLQTLDISRNIIGHEGTSALGEALKDNSSLLLLNVSNNFVSGEGANAIAESLRYNSTIQTLHISDGMIGPEGAKAIAGGLKNNNSLQTLNIAINRIGDIGAGFIGEALKCNKSLQNLDVSGNSIGDEGVETLSQAMKNSSSLHTLSISHNYIGSKGAKCIVQMLSSNKSLRTLDVTHNKINQTDMRSIGQAVDRLPLVQWRTQGGFRGCLEPPQIYQSLYN